MNRRSFLTKSALALFGFTVLPPARTYDRIWKASIPSTLLTQDNFIPNPEYESAPYEQGVIFANGIYTEMAYPMRFVVDENGLFKPVPPFITLDSSKWQA